MAAKKKTAATKEEAPMFEMPPARQPAPEPAVPSGSEPHWSKTVPGEPAYPVKNLDGTFSAGGLVKLTLCVDPAGLPRCIHCGPQLECTGPPNEEMRATMTKCHAFWPRGQ